MCIKTIQKEPQVATKPITVWKFLRKDYSSCANPNFVYKEEEVNHHDRENYGPAVKGLGSFKDRESAEQFLRIRGKVCLGGHLTPVEDLIVTQMVIPEGAKYYAGVFEWAGTDILDTDLEGFESESLFFPKIL